MTTRLSTSGEQEGGKKRELAAGEKWAWDAATKKGGTED